MHVIREVLLWAPMQQILTPPLSQVRHNINLKNYLCVSWLLITGTMAVEYLERGHTLGMLTEVSA